MKVTNNTDKQLAPTNLSSSVLSVPHYHSLKISNMYFVSTCQNVTNKDVITFLVKRFNGAARWPNSQHLRLAHPKTEAMALPGPSLGGKFLHAIFLPDSRTRFS